VQLTLLLGIVVLSFLLLIFLWEPFIHIRRKQRARAHASQSRDRYHTVTRG
jgi:flagellar biosynthesis/type III secretory pathway M-ring protein FliF/YscJ